MTAEEFAERYGASLAKAQAIDKHRADKKQWPWYGRLFHKWVRRNCPACVAEREWTRRH